MTQYIKTRHRDGESRIVGWAVKEERLFRSTVKAKDVKREDVAFLENIVGFRLPEVYSVRGKTKLLGYGHCFSATIVLSDEKDHMKIEYFSEGQKPYNVEKVITAFINHYRERHLISPRVREDE